MEFECDLYHRNKVFESCHFDNGSEMVSFLEKLLTYFPTLSCRIWVDISPTKINKNKKEE